MTQIIYLSLLGIAAGGIFYLGYRLAKVRHENKLLQGNIVAYKQAAYLLRQMLAREQKLTSEDLHRIESASSASELQQLYEKLLKRRMPN